MCPMCITAGLLIAGSVASAGGLTAIVMKKKTRTRSDVNVVDTDAGRRTIEIASSLRSSR